MKSLEDVENKPQVLQVGLFASFPSKSREGRFAQAFFVIPGILVGLLIMWSAELFFEIHSNQIVPWIVFVSVFIAHEFMAAVAPEVFDLVVRRNKRDTVIVIGAYLLGIAVPMVVQTFLSVKEFWGFLTAMLLTLPSIYLPCILFGSPELRKAILPAKRRVPNA